MIVFLIGYMGCGKSKLGRKLAPALGYGLVDTDKMIEGLVGASVSEIFATHGEQWFRDTERKLILSAGNLGNDIVVSTGGGVPCFGDNIAQMNRIGTTIYLRRSPANIVSRLSEHGRAKRPAIAGMNDEQLLGYISTHLPEREPFYNQAELIVDCDALGDERIIEIIRQHLKTITKTN